MFVFNQQVLTKEWKMCLCIGDEEEFEELNLVKEL